MASLDEPRKGRFRIRFKVQKRTQSVYLGQCSKRNAQQVLGHIKELEECLKLNLEPLPKVRQWLSGCDEDFLDRLANAGLTKSRSKMQLGDWTTFVISTMESKPQSKEVAARSRKWLLQFFDETTSLASVTPQQAKEYRSWLLHEQNLASPTVAGYMKFAKRFFREAVVSERITVNPFETVLVGGTVGETQKQFIKRSVIRSVMENCTCEKTRAVIALARFAGLRHQSETFNLHWSDIDWENHRMTIRPVKVRQREVPLMPELYNFLLRRHQDADGDPTHVVSGINKTTTNYHFRKAIKAAGHDVWSDLWHTLRASFQTELSEYFGVKVVSDWVGNSPDVARKHYLQTHDEHFTKAQSLQIE